MPPGLPAGSRAESADAQTPHHQIDHSAPAALLNPLSHPLQASQSTTWGQAPATRLLKKMLEGIVASICCNHGVLNRCERIKTAARQYLKAERSRCG